MPQPKPQQGHKIKWRKPRFIRGDIPWEGIHKSTQKRANRRARKGKAIPVEAIELFPVEHDEGKQEVAANKCGGDDCWRRAAIGDYLCAKCGNLAP